MHIKLHPSKCFDFVLVPEPFKLLLWQIPLWYPPYDNVSIANQRPVRQVSCLKVCFCSFVSVQQIVPASFFRMWKIHAHLWHQCGCLAQRLPHIPDGEQRLQEAAICLAWAATAKCGYWIDIEKHCEEPYGLSPYTPPCPSSSFSFSLPLSVLLPCYAVHWKVIHRAPAWRGAGACQGFSGSYRGQGCVALTPGF